MNIEEIVANLAKTPGVTRRSATKMLFHFIRNKERIKEFTEAFSIIENKIGLCKTCGNIAFEEECPICLNTKRDKTKVCIVEDFEDISNLEKGGWYTGVYHVLGGLLSAQKGMMPENLNIEALLQRMQTGNVTEIIFASNSSFEWQATMHLILNEMQKMPYFTNLKITEFAHGLPIGSSFEYMDEGTLQIAFSGRKKVNA